MNSKLTKKFSFRHRQAFVILFFFMLAITLLARVVSIQIKDRDFLINKGRQQYNKVESIPSVRGKILDRDGGLLAISVESESIYVRPQAFLSEKKRWGELEALIGQENGYLNRRLNSRAKANFVYLQPRLISPEIADQVRKLKLSGVGFEKQLSRFYPHKQETSHILGFTGDDHNGLEGIELIYNESLAGIPGKQRIFRDAKKNIIREPNIINYPQPGKDLTLTVDQRLQYIAFKYLSEAVKKHNADAGSLIILEVKSGEVLAITNQPSFNPNRRSSMEPYRVRNRALTDTFEPGSTIKPFTAAAVISNGLYSADSEIDTSPGRFQLGNYWVGDLKNYGILTVRQILAKSSNVGAIKISQDLEAELLWGMLNAVGFGNSTGLMFPGESFGRLKDFSFWHPTERATLSYGYGMAVTACQLAKAYNVIANDGLSIPLALVKQESGNVLGERVLKSTVAAEMRNMLHTAVDTGTGSLAKISGYSVAGKTGTVRKSSKGGYLEDQHTAIFAGIFPATQPKLVGVVVIDNPSEGGGGSVSAPVFAAVMKEAARVLSIIPDLDVDMVREASLVAESRGLLNERRDLGQ